MSGPLTCWSSCLHRDSFPLSLAQSMMIRSITLVLFRPGNIQPSTLYRIPHCLSHALHSTTHLHDTSNVWQTGRRMVQDEAPAADIFGPMCHEMDGDVCSCLPLQLAELVPRLCAFALGSLPTVTRSQPGILRAVTFRRVLLRVGLWYLNVGLRGGFELKPKGSRKTRG